MYHADYQEALGNGKVRCRLCPHFCLLNEGEPGKCNVRINREGRLISEGYGILSGISTDRIEKKPLYHFYPGHSILSIGGFGCNLTCDFCQNCGISQIDHRILSHHPVRVPEDIVDRAVGHADNIGLAYTYNEPSIYFEYMSRCAELIHERELKNVMVTNGYINPEPLDQLLPLMDAFNVDLKSMRNEFYRNRSGASLKPVLDTIKRIAASGVHMEITFLIIPGYNDTRREWDEMIDWLAKNCGRDTILHVSRYFPKYRLNAPPTPISTIGSFIESARKVLPYVYPGNAPNQDSSTYCPGCGNLIIERNLYHTRIAGLDDQASCTSCGNRIYGIFSNPSK
jgi:pyruvate formate lyase activating enzyme